MILTCPSCGTQYVVKDGAIPPGGRQVRCASCKHSWHQDPEETAAEDFVEGRPVEAAAPGAAINPVESEPQPLAEPQPELVEGEGEESFAEATLIEPRSGPEAEERAFEEAVLDNENEVAGADAPAMVHKPEETADFPSAQPTDDWREPPQAEAEDDEFTPFPTTSEVEPRKRSPLLTILVVAIVVIALAAAFWFLAPPDLKARLGLGGVGATPLALVTTHMDRQRLESGNELLTVTGRVINPTGKEQNVPPLQAQLRTRTGKVVYSWTIAPPARSLPAGASASFNSAEVNVPPGGDELTITLGEDAG